MLINLVKCSMVLLVFCSGVVLFFFIVIMVCMVLSLGSIGVSSLVNDKLIRMMWFLVLLVI